MMKANPRLQITSGLRDKYTSAKLQKKGIGNFGSGTPFIGDLGDGRTNRNSPHSAGWAADLGPRSQYKWLQRNAHKFGLETAAGHGEPWHVQLAGTVGSGTGPMGRMGDLGEPDNGFLGTGIGPSVTGMIGGIPGISDLIQLVKGIYGVVQKIGNVVDFVMSGFGRIKGMMGDDGLLDMTNAGPSKGAGKVTQILSMMGLDKFAGGNSNTVLKYDSAGVGLGPSINFNGESWKGSGNTWTGALDGPGGGAGGGSVGSDAVSRILQRYSNSGQSVQAKTPDAGTVAKMVTVLQAAQSAGFSGDELVAAVALAGRESGFNPRAFNGNSGTGDKSYGLWQINMIDSLGPSRRKSLGISNNDQLFDPNTNAKALRMLFDGRSTPFYDWGPYKGQPALHGGAEDWVPAVYTVAKAQGMVGDPGFDYQAAGGGSVNTNMQFNNTFHISGGGSSGIDIGRIAPMLADRMEAEMRKRLAVVR
jgi:hypothetical protein